MALDVGEVLEAARDVAPVFDAQRQPAGVLLRFLRRLQQRLLNDVVRVAPRLVLQDQDITLPLADFINGVAFAQPFHLRDGTVFYNSEERRAHAKAVSFDRREDPAYFPAFYLRGDTLYLVGFERDWSDATLLRVFHVPAPAAPSLSEPLVLPAEAEPVVVAELAAFMGHRDVKNVDLRALRDDLAEAKASWIDWLCRQAELVAFAQDDYT